MLAVMKFWIWLKRLMTDFKVMEKCHIDGMAEIEEICFNSGFGKQTFLREMENKIAHYIVAETDGKVSGYGGIWNICGEADIIDIATHPDFRKQGIADGILKRLIRFCMDNGCTKINLEVRESNIVAQKLYEKNGFIICGERKKYYDGKETAILMNLNL